MKKFISAFFDKQFLKFCLVGAANTIVGTAVMYGLRFGFDCGYWFSSAMNYVVGSILSYFLNKYFTFNSRGQSWQEIARFVLNIAVCYFVAYGLAKPLVTAVLGNAGEDLRDAVAMLAGMVIFTGLNYLGQRFFAFKRTNDKKSDANGENTLDKAGKS